MATILIIEDEINIRLFITANLSARGYTVIQAGTGSSGLKQARESSPDMIILDMLLPDMQGWDVLNEMSGDPMLSSIPVILMSASVNIIVPTDKVYPNLVAQLVKPASVQLLMETVQSALAGR